MDRWACVDIAALPLQLLLRAHPAWERRPVAVVEDDRPQSLVRFVNALARRAGVTSGLRYAAALTLAPDLQAGTVPSADIDRHISALLSRLRRLTPHVEPAAKLPGVFWLDASGLGHLYASMRVWAERVQDEVRRAGLTASVAVAFTRLGSYALARVQRGVVVCATDTEERALVRRVPIARLDFDPDVRERLRTLGIQTVGEFLRLPADRIRTQFGAPTDALYQLAAGARWAPLLPTPPAERYEDDADFEAPETSTERLVFVVKRLIDGLLPALSARGLAIAHVVLEMTLDNRSRHHERVATAVPTLNVMQLVGLVRLRLETCQLSSGVVAVRVIAGTCDAAPDQRRLFAQHGRRDSDGARHAFARLRAELGDHSVVRARLCETHLPGGRFVWEPLTQMPARSAAGVVAARQLVRRIYTQPVAMPAGVNPLSRESRLHDLAGPFTLSGGWWGGGVHRDYYFARTEQGEIWWFYYDARRRRFFLQGNVE